MSVDEQVGYGNPPKQSRFKKGSSGNPKGRPKGTVNVATVLERTLRERVVIQERGQRKTITKLEAAMKQLVNKAASGDLPALKQLSSLARSVEESPADPSPAAAPAVKEADQKTMQRILKRFEGVPAPEMKQ